MRRKIVVLARCFGLPLLSSILLSIGAWGCDGASDPSTEGALDVDFDLPAASAEQVGSSFQPGVLELIEGTSLGHAAELPDPNESVDVLRGYLDLQGAPDEVAGFERLVKMFPESRHAHVGLAMAYHDEFEATGDASLAGLALREELTAAKIGLSFGQVLYTPWIAQMALDAGEPELARRWFEALLARDPDDFSVNYHLAGLLTALGDGAAEAHYQKAIAVRPEGNIDANVAYAELLLDQGRLDEALRSGVNEGENAYYLDFLHGVAKERLGRTSEALALYSRFEEMSQEFPAPARYRILGSPHQIRIKFQAEDMRSAGDAPSAAAPATTNLSWVIACEAGGESTGGKRIVGWSVRQRVNRGSTYVNGGTCMYSKNTGATMADKYASVICQTSQYSGVTCVSGNVTKCTNVNTRTSTSDQVASDVYNGKVPDPYTGWCPTGTYSGTTKCTATCSGATSNASSFTAKTPHSYLAYAHPPLWGCAITAGAVCGNGGPENYFDYNN